MALAIINRHKLILGAAVATAIGAATLSPASAERNPSPNRPETFGRPLVPEVYGYGRFSFPLGACVPPPGQLAATCAIPRPLRVRPGGHIRLNLLGEFASGVTPVTPGVRVTKRSPWIFSVRLPIKLRISSRERLIVVNATYDQYGLRPLRIPVIVERPTDKRKARG